MSFSTTKIKLYGPGISRAFKELHQLNKLKELETRIYHSGVYVGEVADFEIIWKSPFSNIFKYPFVKLSNTVKTTQIFSSIYTLPGFTSEISLSKKPSRPKIFKSFAFVFFSSFLLNISHIPSSVTANIGFSPMSYNRDTRIPSIWYMPKLSEIIIFFPVFSKSKSPGNSIIFSWKFLFFLF